MARKSYTEEYIIAVLNEAEAGARTLERCRRHGVSEAAFQTPHPSTSTPTPTPTTHRSLDRNAYPVRLRQRIPGPAATLTQTETFA